MNELATESAPDTARLLAEAQRVMAGGVMHHSFTVPGERPRVMHHGEGSRISDTDGNRFIDYYMGSASLLLGHRHPEVVAAVIAQIEHGNHFFALTQPAIELARLVVDAVPSGEKLKYASTGTEAVGLSIRLARAATGRNKILKFEGAYHGVQDWTAWGYRHAKPLAYPRAEPDSRGIPELVGDLVLVAPYNDADAACALIADNSGELAAVVMEPLLGNIRPKPGFLAAIRAATADFGNPADLRRGRLRFQARTRRCARILWCNSRPHGLG